MRAPSLSAASFAQTMSSATRRWPAEVSKPQSVPAKHALRITHRLGHALDAFGDGLRVLDEVGDAVDHAGDDDLIGIEREVAQHGVFVCVARVGERQHEAADIQLAQDRHDLLQFHVAVVRPLECGAKVGNSASIAVAWVRRQPHAVGERWHIQCAVTGYRGMAASVWSECGDRLHPFPPADPRGFFGARLTGVRCLNSATTACPIDTT